MGVNRNEYIHNVASSVMGQIRLTYAGVQELYYFECDDEDFPNKVWGAYGGRILGILGKMGPAARGKIAACGLNSDNSSGNVCWGEVNRGSGLDGGVLNGNDALTLLASYVVVAAMVDICRAQAQRMRENQQRQDDGFDLAMKEYLHCGSSARPINVRARGSEIPDSTEYPPSRR